ncbi:hypothetical protein [Nonomuraea sp. NPDC049480]|uniref:hypothetical protein n=1 Tax=Nonomuraea sp. NPDC049480 TaxID=3364353 RepID=UPI0037A51EC2
MLLPLGVRMHISTSKVELYAAIRRDHRAGLPMCALERKYGVTWRTIRKALDSNWPEPRKKQAPRPTRLDPYKPVIDGMLRADLDAPPKQKHTVKRIFDRLLDEHAEPCDPASSYHGREADGDVPVADSSRAVTPAMCLAASYGPMLMPPVNTVSEYRPSGSLILGSEPEAAPCAQFAGVRGDVAGRAVGGAGAEGHRCAGGSADRHGAPDTSHCASPSWVGVPFTVLSATSVTRVWCGPAAPVGGEAVTCWEPIYPSTG